MVGNPDRVRMKSKIEKNFKTGQMRGWGLLCRRLRKLIFENKYKKKKGTEKS